MLEKYNEEFYVSLHFDDDPRKDPCFMYIVNHPPYHPKGPVFGGARSWRTAANGMLRDIT